MNWQNIFNAINDPAMILDLDNRIVAVNEKTIAVTELSKNKLIGRRCSDIFYNQSDTPAECRGIGTLGREKQGEIIEHRSFDRIFQFSSTPVLNDKNEVYNFVFIARDITKRKKIEEELLQARKMATIGTLAGGIAHDFNNILTAILGYSEIIRVKLPVDSPLKKDINEVIVAGKRATQLIKQILTFSRKAENQRQLFRVDLIVKEAIKMLRSSFPATIDIEMNIEQESIVLADPTNIYQLVVNFCINAMHAIGNKQGVLAISLTRKYLEPGEIADKPKVQAGPFVVLRVKDSGKGMDERTLARIFEPYFTTKEQGKGTGLGLAVAHGIVEKCNGFIEVTSAPEKGTDFHIYLPVIEEEQVKGTEEKNNSTLPMGDENILFVDDEQAITDVGQAILTSLGYRVTTTTKSVDALEKFRAAPEFFDLVITDQTMPGMTGAELGQAMLKLRPELPVILCTGYSSAISEKMTYKLGIKRFIAKPLSRKILGETVRNVLDEQLKRG